jgi:hypothetical protein
MFIACTFRAVSSHNSLERATLCHPRSRNRPIAESSERSRHGCVVPTILIEADRLFRQGVKHLLADTCFEGARSSTWVNGRWKRR